MFSWVVINNEEFISCMGYILVKGEWLETISLRKL
jgi:hypothetical protein